MGEHRHRKFIIFIVMCLEDVISLFDTPVFDLKTLVELLLFC